MHRTNALLTGVIMALVILPTTAAVADEGDAIDQIWDRHQSALGSFDAIVSDFADFLSTDPKNNEAVAARNAARTAIVAEVSDAEADITASAAPYAGSAAVVEARDQAIDSAWNESFSARQQLNELLDSWKAGGTAPPTTTTTAPTTTTTAPTTTTTAPTTTTTAPTTTTTAPTTTTTAPTTTTTAGTSPTTTPPSSGDQGGADGDADASTGQAIPDRPPTFLATGLGPEPEAPLKAAVPVIAPRKSRVPGIVLAWIQRSSAIPFTSAMLGPFLVIEAMLRALVTAGRGLAAPASLLVSLVAVLALDRPGVRLPWRRRAVAAGE